MSTNIEVHEDGRSAVVNGKSIYQDANDNWVTRTEPLTSEESKSFHSHITAIKANKPKYCRVVRSRRTA